jgi:hypothetical protein
MQDAEEVIILTSEYEEAAVRDCLRSDPEEKSMFRYPWRSDISTQVRDCFSEAWSGFGVEPPFIPMVLSVHFFPDGFHVFLQMFEWQFV